MSAYRELLDATIHHLEELRQHGERHVSVQPETLAALAKPAPRAAPRPPAPAPAPAVAVPPAPAPALVAAAPPSSAPPADRAAALAALRPQVLGCVKCPHLASSRRKVVFGVGSPYAELMFVGEAPGADEDAQGEPFVGAAGQLLTKMILAMGLTREQVFIANVLKCRPDTPGQSSGNRKPSPGEMVTCLPWLHQQMAILQPRVLVALGATAMEGLTGRPVAITKERGKWRECQGTPLMPTYHPAYLLRNQSMAVKRQVWEDLLQVMDKLGLPISQKQRDYFTKK